MARIAVLTGSPRAGGNTDMLARAFEQGACDAGAKVDVINAARLDIAPCLGCNHCYGAAHECVYRDDMAGVLERLRLADALVIATPVYFFGISAQLKRLIDRLHNPARSDLRVRELALLAVCASARDSDFDSLRVMKRSAIGFFGLKDGGEVTVSGVREKGDIAGNPALERARELGGRMARELG